MAPPASLKRFVIVRNIGGIGNSSVAELQDACKKSNKALADIVNDFGVQWVHSYVTADKTYCIYLAPDEAAVKKHAEVSGFPADSIEEVQAIIDPVTGYSGVIGK